jgi:hypothetical protein
MAAVTQKERGIRSWRGRFARGVGRITLGESFYAVATRPSSR